MDDPRERTTKYMAIKENRLKREKRLNAIEGGENKKGNTNDRATS